MLDASGARYHRAALATRRGNSRSALGDGFLASPAKPQPNHASLYLYPHDVARRPIPTRVVPQPLAPASPPSPPVVFMTTRKSLTDPAAWRSGWIATGLSLFFGGSPTPR
ncbi:hypothetical protein NL676_037034 [Syzygium grande]|nr:hypothetical protein NL676_037034 [Syzygium grande]